MIICCLKGNWTYENGLPLYFFSRDSVTEQGLIDCRKRSGLGIWDIPYDTWQTLWMRAFFFPRICKFREEKSNGVHKSTKRVRVVSLPSKIDWMSKMPTDFSVWFGVLKVERGKSRDPTGLGESERGKKGGSCWVGGLPLNFPWTSCEFLFFGSGNKCNFHAEQCPFALRVAVGLKSTYIHKPFRHVCRLYLLKDSSLQSNTCFKDHVDLDWSIW